MGFPVVLVTGYFIAGVRVIQFIAIGGVFMFSNFALSSTSSMTMTEFLSMLTSSFTSIMSSVKAVAELIIDTPFLAFTVVFLFAGGVVGIFGRILKRN